MDNIIYDYFLKNFELFYSFDKDKIIYGNRGDNLHGSIIIHQNKNANSLTRNQIIGNKEIIWKKWKGVNIPFLFYNDDTNEIITEENNVYHINYDIILSAFYFLSGWGEETDRSKPLPGRIKFENSFINNLNIIEIPVVNYYFDILHETLIRTKSGKKKNVFQQNNFAVGLTHDIDRCRSAWIEGSFSELKKKRLFSIPKLIFKRFIKKDAWFNFENVSETDLSYGDSSTFFFLPEKGKWKGMMNADYDIRNKKIVKEIDKLRNKGHEIGVHGSFGSHLHSNIFTSNLTKFGARSINGNRFHFLMFEKEITPTVLKKANIKYDSSIGFAEHAGFRRGTCYPFYLFDFKENTSTDVLEFPLIIMDGTLHRKNYMGISKSQAFERIKPVIDEVIKFNGVLTILWHNNYFSEYKYTGWKEVYKEILEYCKNNNGYLSSLTKIFNRINTSK